MLLARGGTLALNAPKLPYENAVYRKRAPMCAALLVALFVGVWPNLSKAQGNEAYPPCARQPTETDIAGAKGAFQAGQASFDEADYQRAIDYWQDAYRRDCTAHALLLNLARAYELNGSKAQAVAALETYLEREPNSPDKDKIDRRLEVLKGQLETERAAVTQAPKVTEAAPPPRPAPPVLPSAPANATQAISLGEQPSAGRSIVPLILAGAGGALAVAGGIFYVSARSDLREAEEDCPDRKCPLDRQDLLEAANQARTRANISGTITMGGVLALGGGLTWYFLSPRTSKGPANTTAQFVPVGAPGYAGFSYARVF